MDIPFFSSSINSASGLEKNAKEAAVKFSGKDWTASERKLSPFDQTVKDALCKLADTLCGIDDLTKIDDSDMKTIGDEQYLKIRGELVSNKLVKETKKEQEQKNKIKDKAKHIKKADLIRQENTTRLIIDEFKKVTSGFSLTDFRIPSGINSKIIEFRAISFMQLGQFIIHNKKDYLNSNNDIIQKKIRFVYNIIISMEKFLKDVTGKDGVSIHDSSQRNNISEILLTDYSILLEEVKKLYNFDSMIAYNNAPELLFYTDYDSHIPSKGFKPYPHQLKITEGVKNAIINKNPTVFSYKAMTGNGKTVTVVALAQLIKNIKNMYTAHSSLQLLFCCNMRSVTEQAAQWLFNANIQFALGVIDGDRGLRVINNYNCKSDETCVAIVCSPEACYEILKNNIVNQYVLFIDEPTIGADLKTSAAKLNVSIMSILPYISILSSATLPHEVYPWIKENHEMRYGKSDFVTIYSNKIHIGCEMKTFEGDLVVPHLHSKNSDDLNRAIMRISEIAFLGRAYTINIVKNMYELMNNESISNLPDINKLFKETENLNTDNVRELAMSMLKLLSLQPNNIIQKVCSSEISSAIKIQAQTKQTQQTQQIQQIQTECSDEEIEWEKEESEHVSTTVIFEKLGTTEAHKFMRQNLIVTTNPLEFAYKNFSDLINDVKKDIISIEKLKEKHLQKKEKWEKEVERTEKEKTKKSDKDNKTTKLDRIKGADELLSSEPKIDFPQKFQINTVHHLKAYTKNSTIEINRNSIRAGIDHSLIPIDSIIVHDWMMILLFCGVGIYTPRFNLNKVYMEEVLRLAEKGELAYLISDSSISYGTNYPINRVFITKDFSDEYSINTIFQVMSRAGRVGKSWIAEAYIDKSCAMRIIKTTTSNEVDIESQNINDIYTEIIMETHARDKKLIDDLEVKKLEEEKKIRKAEEEKIRKDKEKLERIINEQKPTDSFLQGFRGIRRNTNIPPKVSLPPRAPFTKEDKSQCVPIIPQVSLPPRVTNIPPRVTNTFTKEDKSQYIPIIPQVPCVNKTVTITPRLSTLLRAPLSPHVSTENNFHGIRTNTNTTSIASVMTEPPSNISMKNNFRRESSGQVSRRNISK